MELWAETFRRRPAGRFPASVAPEKFSVRPLAVPSGEITYTSAPTETLLAAAPKTAGPRRGSRRRYHAMNGRSTHS